MIERLKINQFYAAPTALRLLLRYENEYVTKYNKSSLKLLGSGKFFLISGHRIGTAEIEERIESIQRHKIDVANRVCNANEAAGSSLGSRNTKLSINDIKLLFQAFDKEVTTNTTNNNNAKPKPI